MKVEKNIVVPLGYGKYFKSDVIVGLVPIEEERGPGRRTFVYVDGVGDPIIASRSENAILRDMTASTEEMMKAEEQRQLLEDILDAVQDIDPMLRSIVRAQGNWDLDNLEKRLAALLK